jgi:hypothetical protein
LLLFSFGLTHMVYNLVFTSGGHHLFSFFFCFLFTSWNMDFKLEKWVMWRKTCWVQVLEKSIAIFSRNVNSSKSVFCMSIERPWPLEAVKFYFRERCPLAWWWREREPLISFHVLVYAFFLLKIVFLDTFFSFCFVWTKETKKKEKRKK